jgi:hypothetical protein
LRAPLKLLVALMGISSACNIFYDEGARFASQVADFAEKFRMSPETTAVFEYTPLYGAGQEITVGIGRIPWCPMPPGSGEGAATVTTERGQAGTGYRIAASASVPVPLTIHKSRGPVRVHMRKVGKAIEIVSLD